MYTDLDYSSFYRHPHDFPIDLATYVVDYNYFEAILDVDGKLYEAPNGHTLGLVKLAATHLGITFNEVQSMCPPEYYADYMTWLQQLSGAVPIWRDFYRGTPNDAQLLTLAIIKEKGWYTGTIR